MMMRGRHVLLGLVLFAGSSTGTATWAASADTMHLLLATAVEQALARHPTAGVVRAASEQARASVGEARAVWLPAFSLSASATQYQEPMVVAPIHGFPPAYPWPTFDHTLFQTAIMTEYTLFDGGGRSAGIRFARRQAEAAAAAVSAVDQALISRTVVAYLDVLGKREVLVAHDRRIEALRAQRDRVMQLHDVGRAADLEILRVEAALTAAEADRVRVAAAAETAERELARLIGLPPDDALLTRFVKVAAIDTALIPRHILSDAAQRANPTILQARRELAAAVAAGDRTRAVRWPSLRAVGSYIDRRNEEGYHTDEWSVGIVLSYPLFAGGAIARAVDRGRAAERAAAEQLRLTEMQIGGDIDRAHAVLVEARARLRSLTVAVDRYAEIVRVETLRLETGVGTQTDYLNAHADLLSATAALVEARHAEIVARVEMARLGGELSVDWIRDHLENLP